MLTCRPIRADEYAAAARLVLAGFRADTAASMEPEGVVVFEAFAAAAAIRARDEAGGRTFIALLGDDLAGVLHVVRGDHVSLFFVDPARQRQGIGAALFATADAAGRLASVNSSLNAVGAYERLGFRATGAADLLDGIRFVPMARQPAV